MTDDALPSPADLGTLASPPAPVNSEAAQDARAPGARLATAALRCPVCRAAFRGTTTCSRCGTDLAPIMRIVAEAWDARERCRAALQAGDLPAAFRWAARERELCSTLT